MAGREELLAALRAAAPPPVPLPDLAHLGVRFADPIEQFALALAGAGGACVRVRDRAAAHAALAALPIYRDAARVVSLAAEIGRSDVDLAGVADPHELDRLDVAVLAGAVAVAENGAVWVDGAELPHRALVVIAEHLVLVVDSKDVVHDMHEAYARLAARALGYGVFIAGPSKTADIEQALVIGAHGARSATVLLLGGEP